MAFGTIKIICEQIHSLHPVFELFTLWNQVLYL